MVPVSDPVGLGWGAGTGTCYIHPCMVQMQVVLASPTWRKTDWLSLAAGPSTALNSKQLIVFNPYASFKLSTVIIFILQIKTKQNNIALRLR